MDDGEDQGCAVEQREGRGQGEHGERVLARGGTGREDDDAEEDEPAPFAEPLGGQHADEIEHHDQ